MLLEPVDNLRLSNLCGPMDRHIRQIEGYMAVEINNRSNNFHIRGNKESVQLTKQLLVEMYISTETELLSSQSIHLHLQNMEIMSDRGEGEDTDEVSIKTKRGMIRGRTINQRKYFTNFCLNFYIRDHFLMTSAFIR